MAMGSMVKVFGWYDNEWGYSYRLVDLARLVGIGAPDGIVSVVYGKKGRKTGPRPRGSTLHRRPAHPGTNRFQRAHGRRSNHRRPAHTAVVGDPDLVARSRRRPGHHRQPSGPAEGQSRTLHTTWLRFASACTALLVAAGADARRVELLPNLRFDPREEAGDLSFAAGPGRRAGSLRQRGVQRCPSGARLSRGAAPVCCPRRADVYWSARSRS